MDEEPDRGDGDPEIAALLTFTPVPRGVVRADGWDPASQRGFIASLAATGNVIAAARAVERSESGAKQLRREDACGEFTAAWRGALALFHRRNPKAGGAAGWHRGEPGAQQEAGWNRPSPGEPDRAALDEHWDLFCNKLLKTYLTKLCQEREARLAGCIVEADFYVRQLCWFDVVLDLTEQGVDAVGMMRRLKRGDLDAGRINATPGSLLLDHVRRSVWAKFGEPDRPPPPELGLFNGAEVSTGGPSQHGANGLSDEELALQAEANRLWEEKARKDAAAWRARLGLPPLAEGGTEEAEDER